MIQKLHLKNFESHKDSTFEFSKGINIITGQSNHGKSSVIRALWWIKDNKPPGNSMISFWNRDKNGNPKKKTFAEVTRDELVIRREKSPDLSGYLLSDKKLEAIGQGPLDEIVEALNLSDINIQYQFDRPFLLDESPLEIARIFNKVIHLDIIDSVQSKTETLRKTINGEISSAKALLNDTEQKIEEMNWIEKAEELNEDIIYIKEEVELIDYDVEKLGTYIEESIKYEKLIALYQSLAPSIDLVKQIDNLNIEVENIDAEIEALENYVYKIRQYEQAFSWKEPTIKAKEIIINVDTIMKEVEEINKLMKNLHNYIENYENETYNITEERKKENELKKLLPKVCPLCGSKLENILE